MAILLPVSKSEIKLTQSLILHISMYPLALYSFNSIILIDIIY